MSLIQRPIALPKDRDALLDIIHQEPAQHPHVIDLPYRLSSEALDQEANGAIWLDDAGRAHAWVILQHPFWAIDLAADGAHNNPEVYAQLLVWADRRARQLAGMPAGRPAWYVPVFEDQVGLIAALEAAGFACQTDAPVDPWVKVLLVRELEAAPQRLGPPTGFAIRPLNGESEAAGYVDLHRAAFESTNMTTSWRRRTLRQPLYCADLDLVAQAAGGQLAGFAIGWFTPDGRGDGPAVQVEPLGVHPEFRRHGLAGALLSELFWRAAQRGARRIYVECDDYPHGPAGTLYRSAGFTLYKQIAVYRKDYDPGSAT
jgi:mycothiol synthase